MIRLICLIFVLVTFCSKAPALERNNISSWQGDAPGGFAAEMTVSPNKINIDQSFVVNLSLTFPATHEPQWEILVPHLLSYDGFGPSPFILESQKIELPASMDTSNKMLKQQFLVTLSPQIPGTHSLTFYDIVFIPKSKAEGKIIKIASGIISIDVDIAPSDFNPYLIMSPPIPVTMDLPITMSTPNRRAIIANPYLNSEQGRYAIEMLRDKGMPWQIFAALITLLILLVLVVINREAAKK